MTHATALWIGGVLVAFLLADLILLGWGVPVLAGRELLKLLEWMAFWR
ncbi:MAG: hypothetical protein AAF914_02475 [Pseudomonadota bacterium]